MRSFLRISVCFFVICVYAALINPVGVQAQVPQSLCSKSSPTIYHAATGDVSAYTEIVCPFAGSPTDRVLVYDRNADMRDTGDWRSATDFVYDFWVFDAGGDGKANLIIDFHHTENTLIADLYDDQNGDAVVDYQFEGGKPVIGESRFWTMKMTAKDGWWARDGKVNFNLDIAIDGPVIAMPITVLDIYNEITQHDGSPDQFITVRDPKYQGKPELDLRIAPAAEDYGVVKTAIMKDYGVREVPMQPGIFWPFLGSAYGLPTGAEDNVMMLVTEYSGEQAYGLVRPPQSFPTPVQVIWSQSKITYLGEFTPSRVANSRFIYSIRSLTPNEINYLDFENPYDYYDLAQANDGFQDLQVRFETYPANDENFQSGKLPEPSTMIRYSWDVNHDHLWDYKLSLTGRHAVDSTVEYGGYPIRSLQHNDTPYWVTERDWDVAQFVEAENGYESTEGIYIWDTLKIRDKYISGFQKEADLSELQTIPPFYRGEYSLSLHSQPFLYFSSIDRKMHLLKAQVGLWNVDGEHEIRTKNLGGDYINEWIFAKGEQVLQRLNVANGYLIYSDANSVRLVRADVAPALFTTLPPRNHDEWADLGKQLSAKAATFEPSNFKAMLDQFAGPVSEIDNAILRDFRLVGNGFRFVIELRRGFTLNGDTSFVPAGLKTGTYVVTYDGAFHVVPLTPPAITATISSQSPYQLVSTAVQIGLSNNGLEDLPASTLEVWATPPEGRATLVATQTVTLLAQQTAEVHMDWKPKVSGGWQLEARLVQPNAQGLALNSLAVSVQPAAISTSHGLLNISSSPAILPFLVVVLFGFGGIAVLSIGYSWHHTNRERNKDA